MQRSKEVDEGARANSHSMHFSHNPDIMVDLGPYFKHLSPTLQKRAREEWLDSHFLRTWCERISAIRRIPPDDARSGELESLLQ